MVIAKKGEKPLLKRITIYFFLWPSSKSQEIFNSKEIFVNFCATSRRLFVANVDVAVVIMTAVLAAFTPTCIVG